MSSQVYDDSYSHELSPIELIVHQLGYPEVKSREYNLIVLNMISALLSYGFDGDYFQLSDDDKEKIKSLQQSIAEVEDLNLEVLLEHWRWNHL